MRKNLKPASFLLQETRKLLAEASKAAPPPTKATKQEWAVVNYLNSQFSPAQSAEHVGAGAKYDLKISVDISSNVNGTPITLPKGAYEVKQDSGAGTDMELARLGSEKATAVISSPLFNSISSLGAIISQKWPGVLVEIKSQSKPYEKVSDAVEYFMSREEGAKLRRCDQMWGYELSEKIFNDVKDTSIRVKANELKVSLAPFMKLSSTVPANAANIFYSLPGDPQPTRLGSASPRTLSRLATLVTGDETTAAHQAAISGSKDSSLAILYSSLSHFLDDFPASTREVEAEITRVKENATKGIVGFFGVKDTEPAEVFYAPSTDLTPKAMTQGGRLILTGKGVQITSAAVSVSAATRPPPFVSTAPNQPTILAAGSDYEDISKWYDEHVNTTSSSKRLALYRVAVKDPNAIPKEPKTLTTKGGFLNAVYRKLNLEGKNSSSGVILEHNFLMRELFPRRTSLVTELALYGRTGLITEGAKEKAIDAVQFIIGAAVEYGIDIPTLGGGTPLGSAAETIIDAAFGAEAVASAVGAIDNVASKAGQFKEIFNKAMAAKGKIKASLTDFYSDVRDIVQEGLELLGEGAQAKVKDFAEELTKIVREMVSKIADAIGDAVKFLIPDAALGSAAGEALQLLIEELAENCFDLIASALKKAGKFAKFITDPAAFPAFIEDAIPKLITFLEEAAKKLEDASLIKAVAVGGGAGLIVKELGPTGLKKLAGILGDKKADIVGLAKKITAVLIPIAFTLLALAQILLKGEYVSEDVELKRKKAKAAAGGDVETAKKEESRLRKSPTISETNLLMREIFSTR